MLKSFRKNEGGAAAVEFALVALPFFTLLFATMELGFKTLLQAELDDLMFSVSMNLSQESDSGITKADYKENIVCGSLSPIVLRCDDIKFGVEAIPNLWGSHVLGRHEDVFVDSWTTGCANSTLIVEFWYPLPVIMLPFGVVDQVERDGETFMRSRSIIRREPLVVGSGTAEGDVPC